MDGIWQSLLRRLTNEEVGLLGSGNGFMTQEGTAGYLLLKVKLHRYIIENFHPLSVPFCGCPLGR